MSVELSGLGDDDDLRDVPLPFIRNSLASLAPRLLAGTDAVTPLEQPSSAVVSSGRVSSLPCSFGPPKHLPASYCIPPTHLLAITFPPSSSTRLASQQVLVPIHALPWGLACSRLRPLLRTQDDTLISTCDVVEAICEEQSPSSDATTAPLTPPATPPTASAPLPTSTATPASQGSPTLALPLIYLRLPSLPAFQLVHYFIYTRSLASSSLFPPSLPPKSRARAFEALWKTCVELGIEPSEGEELWSAMKEEWRFAQEGMPQEELEDEEQEWTSGESDEEADPTSEYAEGP